MPINMTNDISHCEDSAHKETDDEQYMDSHGSNAGASDKALVANKRDSWSERSSSAVAPGTEKFCIAVDLFRFRNRRSRWFACTSELR